MSGVGYLLHRQTVNGIKSFLRTPRKLILTLVFILLLGSSLAGAFFSNTAEPVSELRDMREFYAVVFGFFALAFLVGVSTGFKNGAAFFSLADVQLLFGAPVSRRRMLFYGLIRQGSQSLFVGLMLIYQYGWMKDAFDVSLGMMGLAMLGYFLSMFCGQVAAMGIYSLSSRLPAARKILMGAVIAYVLVIAGALAVEFLADTGAPLQALVRAANSTAIRCLPVAGWLSAGMAGAAGGGVFPVIASLAGCAAFVAVIIWLLGRGGDFYEEVLLSAETNHVLRESMKKGGTDAPATGKVRLGKLGIGRGRGASAVFYRLMKEEKRRDALPLLPGISLIFIAVTAAVALFSREATVYIPFAVSLYVLIFSVTQGTWARELSRHYVFLIPASSGKKLAYMCLPQAITCLIESAVMFVIIAAIYLATGVSLSPLLLLCLFAARASTGFMFIAGTVMSERLFGSSHPKGFVLAMYMMLMVAILLPGLVGGLILSGLFEAELLTPVVMTVWNLVCTGVLMLIFRNTLDWN